MRIKLFKFGMLISIGFLMAAGFSLYGMARFASQPISTVQKHQTVHIRTGQDLGTTAVMLFDKGLITSVFKFKVLARYHGIERQLKAGEYVLSPHMSPNEIILSLVEGKVRLYRLTVPEGYAIYQIGELVEKNLGGNREAFIKAATDASFARQMKIDGTTFEGYLFPDTYYFPKETSSRAVIKTMVNHFWTVFTPEWEKRAVSIGLTVHEVVTLASMIEKETGDGAERPIISSVFHNRLKKRMRLASDPTVIYGIPDFDGNLTRKHLRTVTPYNTYATAGLPLGPIANPGKLSLEAALFPATTRFLYFVSKKDSTHKFSTNFEDHNQAVKKYQLRRK